MIQRRAMRSGIIDIPGMHTGIIDIPTLQQAGSLQQESFYGGDNLPGGTMQYYTLGQVGQEEKEKQEIEAAGDKPAENGITKMKIFGLPAIYLAGAVGIWLLMKK
jgi:hypothetical protein